jgi:hypothetical protein
MYLVALLGIQFAEVRARPQVTVGVAKGVVKGNALAHCAKSQVSDASLPVPGTVNEDRR